MNRHVRQTIAMIEAAGANVESIGHGRHTEITIAAPNGKTGVLRLHKGTSITPRHERGLRSAIRRIIED